MPRKSNSPSPVNTPSEDGIVANTNNSFNSKSSSKKSDQKSKKSGKHAESQKDAVKVEKPKKIQIPPQDMFDFKNDVREKLNSYDSDSLDKLSKVAKKFGVESDFKHLQNGLRKMNLVNSTIGKAVVMLKSGKSSKEIISML